MKIFILEDDPVRNGIFARELIGHEVTFAHNAYEAEDLIKQDPDHDLFLLDHDLGGNQMVSSDNPNTGYQFLLKESVKKAITDKVVIIHSFNPEGATRMLKVAEEYTVFAIRVPFNWEKILKVCKGAFGEF